ncbi:hypothetical protein DIPPA_05460 [Diplonema papillatum]|nr:hypothetical protein DIPPA_05460 [Diplonema papillatum]
MIGTSPRLSAAAKRTLSNNASLSSTTDLSFPDGQYRLITCTNVLPVPVATAVCRKRASVYALPIIWCSAVGENAGTGFWTKVQTPPFLALVSDLTPDDRQLLPIGSLPQ